MPKVEGAPAELNELLETVHRNCMVKVKDEEKCAKIAWGAAKRAGWTKGEDGNWKKE